MQNIFVMTVATDVYKVFVKNLCYSLKNLIPLRKYGYKLNFLILTDGDDVLDDCEVYDEFTYISKHTINFPYPYNATFKFNMLYDCVYRLEINPTDKFIFVDADSVFRKMDDEFFKRLDQKLKSDNTYFAYHCWRNYDPGSKNFEQEMNNKSCTHIDPDKYVNERYVQTSFMMGSIEHIGELLMKMNVWFAKIYEERKLPYLVNQCIVNKILSEEPDYAIVEPFIFTHDFFTLDRAKEYADNYKTGICSCYDTCKIDEYPDAFVYQKYDKIKESKRLD